MPKKLTGREVMNILDHAKADPYPEHAMARLYSIVMLNRSQFASTKYFDAKLHQKNITKLDVIDSIRWILNQITKTSVKKNHILHHQQSMLLRVLNNQLDVTHNQYDVLRELSILSKYDVALSHTDLLARLPKHSDSLITYLELVCGLITKYQLINELKKSDSYIDSIIKSLCIFITSKYSNMTVDSLMHLVTVDLKQSMKGDKS